MFPSRHAAISPAVAVPIAGRNDMIVKRWAERYGIGRRAFVRWEISRVALAMLLDDDRTGPRVGVLPRHVINSCVSMLAAAIATAANPSLTYTAQSIIASLPLGALVKSSSTGVGVAAATNRIDTLLPKTWCALSGCTMTNQSDLAQLTATSSAVHNDDTRVPAMLNSSGTFSNMRCTPGAGSADVACTVVDVVAGLYYTPLPHALTNAALQAFPTGPGASVERVGFSVPGDSPPVRYRWASASCSRADNGLQVTATSGGCWTATNINRTAADVRIWGAACNGLASNPTDDSTSINNALYALGSSAGVRLAAHGLFMGIRVHAGVRACSQHPFCQ